MWCLTDELPTRWKFTGIEIPKNCPLANEILRTNEAPCVNDQDNNRDRDNNRDDPPPDPSSDDDPKDKKRKDADRRNNTMTNKATMTNDL
jgi:hypothetical protein